MHRREEMLAHRVGRAGALAPAVVLLGAVVVAVRVSGGLFRERCLSRDAPEREHGAGGAPKRHVPRQAGTVDGIAARRDARDNHDSSTAARDDVREDLPRRLPEHQVPVVGIAIGSGEAQDQRQAA